jgi:hypothetical protein
VQSCIGSEHFGGGTRTLGLFERETDSEVQRTSGANSRRALRWLEIAREAVK